MQKVRQKVRSEMLTINSDMRHNFGGIGTGMSKAPVLFPIFPNAAEEGIRPRSIFDRETCPSLGGLARLRPSCM